MVSQDSARYGTGSHGDFPAAPVDTGALAAALRPFGASRMLPPAAYTSAEVFAWERRHFFGGGWTCVAHGSRLPRPGDQLAVDTGTGGALLVRGEDGTLRAFANTAGPLPLAGLDAIVAPYEPERLVVTATHSYDAAANWKGLTENYHECYHCPTIHPELCSVSPPHSGANYPVSGSWIGGWMSLVPSQMRSTRSSR